MEFRTLAFASSIVLAGGLAACEGCRPTTGNAPPPHEAQAADVGPSTLRFYIVSDLAGALEPCGCVKDQLGGLDHAAAWMESEKGKSQTSALIAAGPLFFLDPVVTGEKRAQDLAKAETLAPALRGLNFVAFAPGRNDWAAGSAALADLAKASGASLLFANGVNQGGATADAGAPPLAGAAPHGLAIREMSGVKVAFVGVSAPDKDVASPPIDALGVTAPVDAVRAAVAEAKRQGATLFIALASVGRGEAKRIAEAVPELTAIVVGSPGHAGDSNTKTPAPDRVGNVLIAETGNHLQTVAVLDLFVRNGQLTFADATGLERSRKRADLTQRIDELRGRIAQWETNGRVAAADIDARKKDVAKLEAERAALDATPAPAEGSYFRYTLQEIREGLGRDKQVTEKLLAYYKRVNEENKVAFATRTPRKPAADEASYVGIDVCSSCHAPARAVWDKTQHARAYVTLSSQFKEYNLDCVSCHVTGYERPGGSTVTHVEKLKDVQCEVCHGPGSKHVAAPTKEGLLIERPASSACEACHHPPHVHEFDAARKITEILGPGHGQPVR